MPEVGKDFPPMLNGVNLMPGPSPASVGSGQANPLERTGGMLHHQQQQSTTLPQNQSQQQSQQTQAQAPPQLQTQLGERDGEIEPQQLTAIFRPDDAGEWKEKLRLSHEAAERDRMERSNEVVSSGSSSSSWERRPSDEDEGGNIKEVEDDEDDEDSTSDIVGEGSEGDGGKLWKPKRTLRK
jgi:striatin 1/3/4